MIVPINVGIEFYNQDMPKITGWFNLRTKQNPIATGEQITQKEWQSVRR